MTKAQGIPHDTAAQLLGVAPGVLTALVRDGHVRRIDANAYAIATLVQDYVAYVQGQADRLNRHPTQKEAGEHLDLSDRSIRELEVEFGLKGVDYTLDTLRIRYIRDLREKAAGRAAAGDLDLATERARLASEQADKVAMQNAERRGELAPVVMMEQALAGAATRATRILDTIKGEIRRRMPQLPAADLRAVDVIVNKALSTVALMTLTDVLDDGVDDDEELLDQDDSPSGPDQEPVPQ